MRDLFTEKGRIYSQEGAERTFSREGEGGLIYGRSQRDLFGMGAGNLGAEEMPGISWKRFEGKILFWSLKY